MLTEIPSEDPVPDLMFKINHRDNFVHFICHTELMCETYWSVELHDTLFYIVFSGSICYWKQKLQTLV